MVSYGLYVWHKFVPLNLVEALLDAIQAPEGLVQRPVVGPRKRLRSSVCRRQLQRRPQHLVAECSWRLFELPINRLKRHFMP